MTLPAPDRRTFLSALIGGIAGGTALAGCSSNGDSASTTTTGVGRTGGAPQPADPGLSSDPFTLGVASGDPLPDSVVLWTRLAPEPGAPGGGGAMPADDVEVGWEIATDDAFSDIVASGIATAPAVLGHSVHVAPDGLDPDTWFHYRFFIGDRAWVSPVGRTRTMPREDAEPDTLRLAFASCQDFGAGYYPAYRAMAADELDLVFFLGDYIYEYGTDGTGPRPVLPTAEVMSLGDYRLRYASYKQDPDLQAAHASCPWITTWDDHEVENNHAGLSAENEDPDGDLEAQRSRFAARRAAAYQAYYEHQPLRLDPPAGADFRVYRSVNFGTLAEMFVLDGRQYRSDQACNSPQDAFVDSAGCPELDDEDRTMLGAEQEAWLSEGLADSTAIWKVLAQQTVMSSLVIGDMILNVDQWDGYPAARRRLLGFIADNDISDTVVLTGDIHSAGAGELSVTDESGATTVVAAEFVGTSITSSTLADSIPGGAGIVTPELFPGIKYLNIREHGYGRCTVTPERWTTDFVMVESIESPDSPARVDATLVVDAGSSTMTREA